MIDTVGWIVFCLETLLGVGTVHWIVTRAKQFLEPPNLCCNHHKDPKEVRNGNHVRET